MTYWRSKRSSYQCSNNCIWSINVLLIWNVRSGSKLQFCSDWFSNADLAATCYLFPNQTHSYFVHPNDFFFYEKTELWHSEVQAQQSQSSVVSEEAIISGLYSRVWGSATDLLNMFFNEGGNTGDQRIPFCVTRETFSKSQPFKHIDCYFLAPEWQRLSLVVPFHCVCSGFFGSSCDSWTATHGNITIVHIKMFYWLSGA